MVLLIDGDREPFWSLCSFYFITINNFNDFVKEYYNNADLDIISNLSDFEFVDRYHQIIDVLKNNISTKLGKLDVEINSNFISHNFFSSYLYLFY